jgi:2-(1,2-epoxy-1,2-dihydrophenyl)acetyl-CoA isomerase
MKNLQFNVDYDLFSGEINKDIAIVNFKEKPIMHTADLQGKEVFFDYLDFISTHEKVKAILLFWPSKKAGKNEYLNFYNRLSKLRIEANIKAISRFYNAINQFILKVMACDKIIISADCGEATLLYLSVSLACDYRIISENSFYSNPNIELGAIPNGGAAYFLTQLIGHKKTFDFLISGSDISAAEAFELGIVDKVVPETELKEAGLDVAKTFNQKPSAYLSGIKQLVNYNTSELKKALDCEEEILRKSFNL